MKIVVIAKSNRLPPLATPDRSTNISVCNGPISALQLVPIAKARIKNAGIDESCAIPPSNPTETHPLWTNASGYRLGLGPDLSAHAEADRDFAVQAMAVQYV